MIDFSQEDQYKVMHGLLNERQWRLYVATEARRISDKDETLRADLEELLEPKGDPQSLVRWTSKSMSKLKEALGSQGHTIGATAIRELLIGMGFSLKANKKTIEGTVHVDRDAQFQQINRTGKAFKAAGKPMISVDCEKKELMGNFKNNGREWQAKGQDTRCQRL